MAPRRPRNKKKNEAKSGTKPRDSGVGEVPQKNEDAHSSQSDATTTSRKKSASTFGKETRPPTGTRRSKRVKVQQDARQSDAVNAIEENDVARKNTSGLAMLPSELLSEILSYLPQIRAPFRRNLVQPLRENDSGLERLAFLRVLSQTCRSLRSFALPLCWETIQAISCDEETMKSEVSWKKTLATDLVRQLEIVTVRDPSLAQYVKVVTVLMSSWCINGVTKELARCLALFPNLHTLQILGNIEAQYRPKFSAFFSKVTLPGVRTLALSSPAAIPVVHSCPGIVTLVPLGREFSLPSADFGFLPCLERLDFVRLDKADILREAIRLFPRLKVIDLVSIYSWDYNSHSACLELMPQLKNLHCIRIYSGVEGGLKTSIPAPILTAAKEVLQNSTRPAPGFHKCVHQVVNGQRKHILIFDAGVPGMPCPYL